MVALTCEIFSTNIFRTVNIQLTTSPTVDNSLEVKKASSNKVQRFFFARLWEKTRDLLVMRFSCKQRTHLEIQPFGSHSMQPWKPLEFWDEARNEDL